MAYVIQRTDDGAYLAPPGGMAAYTRLLQHAHTFLTREAAERDRCVENERVLSLEEAMRYGQARQG